MVTTETFLATPPVQPKYLTRCRKQNLERWGRAGSLGPEGADPRSATDRSQFRGYFLYRNIASATKATVMTHRMMSLVLFFSSAIG